MDFQMDPLGMIFHILTGRHYMTYQMGNVAKAFWREYHIETFDSLLLDEIDQLMETTALFTYQEIENILLIGVMFPDNEYPLENIRKYQG